MRAQRVREGESRVEMQSAKWTGDVWAYVSCRGYAGILQRAQGKTRESRWHRGDSEELPSLTEPKILSGTFILSKSPMCAGNGNDRFASLLAEIGSCRFRHRADAHSLKKREARIQADAHRKGARTVPAEISISKWRRLWKRRH